MPATFVHLSGSKRGRSETFDRDRLLIGTGADGDLRLDGRAGGDSSAPLSGRAALDQKPGPEVRGSMSGLHRAYVLKEDL